MPLRDHAVYGTLCGFAYHVDETLDDTQLSGVRLMAAIVADYLDDLGTGFSGLERILQLGPDILKIDKALVRNIDTCPARHALVAALASFAGCMGTTIVAEGIETAEELAALCALDIDCGQGYHLARPGEPHQLATDRIAVDAATAAQLPALR